MDEPMESQGLTEAPNLDRSPRSKWATRLYLATVVSILLAFVTTAVPALRSWMPVSWSAAFVLGIVMIIHVVWHTHARRSESVTAFNVQHVGPIVTSLPSIVQYAHLPLRWTRKT